MDKEYFGDSENAYLQKVLDKCSNGFGHKDVDQKTGKPVILRTHVRFDLGNSRLPKFCLDDKLWSEAVKQFLVINKSLRIVSQENLSFERDDLQKHGQSEGFDFGDVKSASSKIKFSILNDKVISQLGRVIELLKKDPHSRRLLVCSLDPREPDPESSEVGNSIFQFVVNFKKLNACLYLTSCDLELHFPVLVLLFSLLVVAVGQVIDVEPGELVVFSERTRLPENRVPFPDVLLARNVPSPKPRVFRRAGDGFCPDRGRVSEDLRCENTTPVSKQPSINNQTNIGSSVDMQGAEINPDETKYLDLVGDIISQGCLKPNRTGIDARALTGVRTIYDLRDGTIPLLTTKRVFWKGVVEELMWFIKGSTDANELAEKGVHIWDANGSRQYLDGLGFRDREEGDLGPVYGFQWRHFGAEYRGTREDYSGEGVDQLKEVVENVKSRSKDGPTMVTSWNADDIDKMALPPCHVAYHFTVDDGELSCSLYQRSADMGLGVPFNIASYSLLTHMVAHVAGLETGDLVHCICDAHVYENHVGPLREQMAGDVRQFPKLVFKRRVESVEGFEPEDFELVGYAPSRKIKLAMAL